MDTRQVVIAVFALFFSGATFTFIIAKFAFRGYLRELSARIDGIERASERIEKDGRDFRLHCDKCRSECRKENKDDFNRVWDKIGG